MEWLRFNLKRFAKLDGTFWYQWLLTESSGGEICLFVFQDKWIPEFGVVLLQLLKAPLADMARSSADH